MNHNPISQDDPRLTAYALNEMAPAEQAQFEQLLQQDAAARQVVEEIRATAGFLTDALEREPMVPAAPEAAPKASGGKVLRFPQFYYAVSGLAAACFALFFVYWQQGEPGLERKNYTAVTLSPPVQMAGAAQGKGDAKEVVSAQSAAMTARASIAQDEISVSETRAQAETLSGAAEFAHKKEMERRAVGLMKMKASPAPAPMAVLGGGLDARSENDASGRVQTSASALIANRPAAPDFNTEAYRYRKDSDYLRVADQPLSTFAVDVDTAAYANVRRFLTQGQRPPADAVRIEELVNYFPYAYQPPTGNAPFATSLEVAAAPWAPEHRLVRIGLKGREVNEAARPAASLVFLLDVSGSMNEPNKLPLVKQSLRLMVEKLRPDDRVAIAVYAGASGLALPSTRVANKAAIMDAIERLQAEGSTNGAMGIELAYDLAQANFITGGVNRVILATDGDFNVGVTSEGELVRLVTEKAKSGVFLTVLGFGMGNLKDSPLEQLADTGNGNYAYIDSWAEAKKTLVEQAGGTLVTIAKDVKIQVEFNPLEVSAYRLIGYENRLLAKEDFNNDRIDAGEIGAGHAVTALYEVVPTGVALPPETGGVDALKYQKTAASAAPLPRRAVPGVGPQSSGAEAKDLSGPDARQTELLTVKIRYKEPTGDVSAKLDFPLRDTGKRFEEASQDFKFAAAVASFGMLLRDSPHKGTATLAQVTEWGRAGLGQDAGGYRNEFIALVERAAQIGQ